jgi:hypothetical protein
MKPLNDWASFKEKIADPIKKGRTKVPMKRLHVRAYPIFKKMISIFDAIGYLEIYNAPSYEG